MQIGCYSQRRPTRKNAGYHSSANMYRKKTTYSKQTRGYKRNVYTREWQCPILRIRNKHDDLLFIIFHVRRSRGEKFNVCYILITVVCVSVCLCFAAFPHYCTDVNWENGRELLSSCAQLGGFAIGARVSLLWQQRRTRNVSECLYSFYVPGPLCIVAPRRLYSTSTPRDLRRYINGLLYAPPP